MNTDNKFILTDFLLNNVKEKPGMYLMDNDLKSLQKFITGYRMAMELNQMLETDIFINDFSDWFISNKALRAGSMWYSEILEECNGEERAALNRFWEYLEIFKAYKSS